MGGDDTADDLHIPAPFTLVGDMRLGCRWHAVEARCGGWQPIFAVVTNF